MTSATLQLEQEKLIGKGLTSDVFSWGKHHVLKLYFPWMKRSTAELEFVVTNAVHSAGLPSPAATEMVEVNDRQGIVFERVQAPSMLKQVEIRPWNLFAAARQLAELHVQMHSYSAPVEMPAQSNQMTGWVEGAPDYTTADKERARGIISQLPEPQRICHGDFHPANILMAANGPVIIDWSTGTRGHPMADVARTSVLFEHAQLPPGSPLHIRLLMKLARGLLHRTYLKRYLQIRPGTYHELEKWRVPLRFAASAWKEEREVLMRNAARTLHKAG